MYAFKPIKIIFNPFLFVLILLLLSFTTGNEKSDYTIPLSPYSVTTADLDLDGDKDIICGHNVNTATQWSGISRIINNSGYFTLHDSVEFFGWQGSVQAVNLDVNPIPEIIAKYEDFNQQNEYVGILYNNDLGIINYFSLNTYEGVDKIATGFINNDNFLDIIVSSTNAEMWGVLFNNGNGGFSAPEYHSANYPRDITCGNLNNDIFDDIVVGGSYVYIILPNETGFEELVFPDGYYDVFIDDFDFDGDNDVVEINGMYTWNYFSYLENQGNNTFIQHTDTTTHPGGHNFFVTDLNNDSLSDILYVDNNFYGVCIYYNKGGFHLKDPVNVPIIYYGENSRDIYCDDMDGNGYNDIIIIRKHGYSLPSNLVILFNNGQGAFLENPITTIDNSNIEFKDPVLFCHPNPFNDLTKIKYFICEKGKVGISIYNLKGEKIINLFDKAEETGNGLKEWNGLNSEGHVVESGIYLVTLILDNQSSHTIKIIKN